MGIKLTVTAYELLTTSFGGGERIRTSDLQVMSLTSCHCSTPRQKSAFLESLATIPHCLSMGKVKPSTKIASARQVYLVVDYRIEILGRLQQCLTLLPALLAVREI